MPKTQHPLSLDAEKVKEKKRTLKELSIVFATCRINPGQRAAITLAISEILRTTREHIAVGSVNKIHNARTAFLGSIGGVTSIRCLSTFMIITYNIEEMSNFYVKITRDFSP